MVARPRWQRDEMRQIGTDYADPQQVRAFEERQRYFRNVQADAEIAIEGLGLKAGHSLIDVGAGTGVVALLAAGRCARVYAVDVSEAMLDCARRKADEAGASNIEFHHAGFLTYDHRGGPADAIITQMAMHHLPDAWKSVALARLAGMLKDGGRLCIHDVVFTFDPADYKDVLDGMVRDFARATDEDFARQLERHLRDEFSTFDWIMEGLLRRAGFRIDRAEYRTGPSVYFCTKGAKS